MTYRIECERIWNEPKIAYTNHIAGWKILSADDYFSFVSRGVLRKVKCKKVWTWRRKKIKWPWKH